MKIIKTASGNKLRMSFNDWKNIGSASGWLEASTYREVFHGSNTGVNNVNINSFKNGISSKNSDGNGQGEGFFVFTDLESARKHAIDIASDNIYTKSLTDGLPMVVKIAASINPSEWSIDFELNFSEIKKFIIENIEYFKKMFADRDLKVEDPYFPEMSPGSKGVSVRQRIKRDIGNTLKTRHLFDDDSSDFSMADGEFFNHFFKKLNEKDPEAYNAFTSAFFDRMPPKTAIKYVGSGLLKPNGFEVLQNGKWILV